MCNVVVVRPGATVFDEQERIKGSLDIPLSSHGLEQIQRVATELERLPIAHVYCGPCESAQETAKEIADHSKAKWKVCDCFANLDHGLWEGKRIDEVKRQQPKLFRQVQDNPRAFCPPGGETIDEAEARVSKLLSKLCKKHANETIAVVVSEPLATLVANKLMETDIDDMWESECDNGSWELIDADTHQCVDSDSQVSGSLTDGQQSAMGDSNALAGSSSHTSYIRPEYAT
ncbi:Phosphoserine phosphatase 1 [Pirellula sp. SH-Sr6A]|uniref:histidine phosphatase family protein n=1 Tax=Pirellula sp. SH-Sr6A TaxID=1632865 RepID=UPI00078BB59C|nr:histidine phosphatase family protein [Pirellula sp. SH-Sr6A]AMV31936.1 Phosphoserine phosphatase 1 [Pirellula sp. SH-Sr6A]